MTLMSSVCVQCQTPTAHKNVAGVPLCAGCAAEHDPLVQRFAKLRQAPVRSRRGSNRKGRAARCEHGAALRSELRDALTALRHCASSSSKSLLLEAYVAPRLVTLYRRVKRSQERLA